MAISRFEDIIAWQKAQDLAVSVKLSFKDLKDFSFSDQINRASVSISNNIAEGFGRSSDADFKRFLYIALGSVHEVKSMLYLAERLEYSNSDNLTQMRESCSEIAKVLNGLMKSLR